MALYTEETEAYSDDELEFFAAGDDLENTPIPQFVDFSDLEKERPSFWNRVFRTSRGEGSKVRALSNL